MNRRRSLLARGFLLGFCAALPFCIWAFRHERGHGRWADSRDLSESREARARFIAVLPPGAIRPQISDPVRAKLRRFFCAVPIGKGTGIAVDALGNPDVFSALFPGYPEVMRRDAPLWRDYFSREFSVPIASEMLSAGTPFGAAVYQPWIGCLDVYRRYGADIVVLGASDTGRAVPPDLLARLLREARIEGLENPRVLNCAATSMQPEAVGWMVSEMLASGRRARWVIYGYTPTFGYTQSPYYEQVLQSKLPALKEYQEELFLGAFGPWNRPPAVPWSWDDVIPLNRSQAAGEGVHLQVLAEEETGKKAYGWKYVAATSGANPSHARRSKERVENDVKTNPFLTGMGRVGCGDFSDMSDRLGETLALMRRVGEKTLLYVNPTMDQEMAQAPDCFIRDERTAISAMRGKVTVLDTAGMKDLGLDPSDFAAFKDRSPTGETLYLDMVHVNDRGADKVSRHLADLIVREERR